MSIPIYSAVTAPPLKRHRIPSGPLGSFVCVTWLASTMLAGVKWEEMRKRICGVCFIHFCISATATRTNLYWPAGPREGWDAWEYSFPSKDVPVKQSPRPCVWEPLWKLPSLAWGSCPERPAAYPAAQSHEAWGAVDDLIYSIVEPKITDELFFPNGTWKGHSIDLKNKSASLCVPRFW